MRRHNTRQLSQLPKDTIFRKNSFVFIATLFQYKRVPNRFFGIRDLAYFKAGIRDSEGKGRRDSGL